MKLKHYTIPIFIPELACPFQCVFCNQRKITGVDLIPDDKGIIQSIDEHLLSFKETERIVEVGFFGGSFTGIPVQQQKHYLDLVQPFLEDRQISGIRLSTRPDYIDDEILELLRTYKVSTIELGAQSLDDAVLNESFRGHTSEQVGAASQKIIDFGFELGLQMMIGLPADTLEKSIETAKKIISLGASNTRIYPVVVIKGTALENCYKSGKFKPLSLEEAVDWTKHILPIFEDAGVRVIRVGLHPSEGLLNGDELVDGPFHQSFKELVLTEIWGDLLKPLIEKPEGESIELIIPEKEINYAIGYRAKNKNALLEKYKSVKFIGDPGISHRRNFQYR